MKAVSNLLKTVFFLFLAIVLAFAIFTVFFGQNTHELLGFITDIGYWIFDIFVGILTYFKEFFVGLKTPTMTP